MNPRAMRRQLTNSQELKYKLEVEGGVTIQPTPEEDDVNNVGHSIEGVGGEHAFFVQPDEPAPLPPLPPLPPTREEDVREKESEGEGGVAPPPVNFNFLPKSRQMPEPTELQASQRQALVDRLERIRVAVEDSDSEEEEEEDEDDELDAHFFRRDSMRV